MQKLFTLAVLSAALVAGASAQSTTKIDKPWRAELGLYIPTFSGGDKDLGGSLGLGYSFYKVKDIEFAGVARGSFFSGSNAGFDADITLTTLGIDARYRPMGEKYFFGLGLAAIRADEDIKGFGSDDTTKLGYSVEAGYDISDKLYGVVRFQGSTSDIKAFQGITVGVGYRF